MGVGCGVELGKGCLILKRYLCLVAELWYVRTAHRSEAGHQHQDVSVVKGGV